MDTTDPSLASDLAVVPQEAGRRMEGPEDRFADCLMRAGGAWRDSYQLPQSG